MAAFVNKRSNASREAGQRLALPAATHSERSHATDVSAAATARDPANKSEEEGGGPARHSLQDGGLPAEQQKQSERLFALAVPSFAASLGAHYRGAIPPMGSGEHYH